MRAVTFAILVGLLVQLSPLAEAKEAPEPSQASDRKAKAEAVCIPARLNANIGIHVGCPKIYDNRALELMLAAAEQDLAKLKFFDQAGVAKQIGATQGGTATESNFGVQLTGLPTPQITTTAGTSNSLTQSATAATAPTGPTTSTTSQAVTGTTGGTTVTQNPVSPTAPSLGTLSGASSLPSSFSNSALSTLNEQLQLTYEIANLRLLLEGSLSDHFVGTSRAAKRRVTIGFPISIEPLASRDAIAEVEVTVKSSDSTQKKDEKYTAYMNNLKEFRHQGRPKEAVDPPGLVTILPRERSYNVAHITDNQKSFAGAAVLSVLSLGVSWTGRTKTFYLLQDLDTVALERTNEADPSSSTSFAWQFRPVLNQPTVTTGLRQTFVQLAFAVPPTEAKLGTAKVVVRWRKYARKTREVGEVLTWRNPRTHAKELMEATVYEGAPLTNFDLSPDPQLLNFSDVGQGRVAVRVAGDFLPDTYVRIGDSILDEPSNTLFHDPSGLRFVAPAASLMSLGATLVARDGSDTPLRNTDPSCSPPEDVVVVKTVTASPFDDTNSLVTIELDPKSKPFPNDFFLVLIGNQLFGLRDAPLRQRGNGMMILTAPTSLLRSARRLSAGFLFCGNPAVADLKFVGDFTAAKLVRIAGGADGPATFAITGSDLAEKTDGKLTSKVDVYLVDPTRSGSTTLVEKISPLALAVDTLVITVSKERLAALKQVLVVDTAGKGQPMTLPLTTPPGMPEVKPPAPIAKGPARPLTLLGSGLDAVERIVFQGSSLSAVRSLDNNALTVDLPEAVTMHTPSSILLLVTKDKSEIPVVVTVVGSSSLN